MAASKKKPATECGCAHKVNELLKPKNTRLVLSLLFRTHGAVDLRLRPVISTERIENRRDGKRAVVMHATFCPFCGKRYPE